MSRNHWKECVMPQNVIHRVHRLTRRDDVSGVEFRDQHGDILSEENNSGDENAVDATRERDEAEPEGSEDDNWSAGVEGAPNTDTRGQSYPEDSSFNGDAILSPAGISVLEADHMGGQIPVVPTEEEKHEAT